MPRIGLQSGVRPAVLTLLLLGGSLLGCNGRSSYPEVQVTSPIDRPGVCASCKAKIPSVVQANLFDAEGCRYVVCGTPCIERLKKRLEWEKGR